MTRDSGPAPRPSGRVSQAGGRTSRTSLQASRADLTQPRQPRRLFVAALLVLFAVVLYEAVRPAPAPFTQREELAFGRFAIFLAAVAVEAYRDSTGTLPASLSALGVDEQGLSYRSDGMTYALTVELAGEILSYSDGEDLTPYGEAFDELRGRP